MSNATMVDWNLALQTGRKLVKAGPEISRAGAVEVVASLRDCAARAEEYVQQVTGLQAASGTAPVLIIDRPGWIQANLDAFQEILSPLQAKRADQAGGSGFGGLSARVGGLEVGALLSYLAPKVLGQFDPFSGPSGRLLLVAPNVVAVERELRVASADFRLWVTLHEETHRVQFTAVPWLRDYFRGQIAQIIEQTDLEPAALAQAMRQGAGRVSEIIRGDSEASLIDLFQNSQQQAIVERITAVMSLLEGHADVVMDSVGPEVIPTVASIRAKFTVRREGHGFDKVIRRLLGLDAKMRQYRDGAAFCRQVIGQVGMTGLNAVWESPESLPSKEEIAAPQLWLDRVHPPRRALNTGEGAWPVEP